MNSGQAIYKIRLLQLQLKGDFTMIRKLLTRNFLFSITPILIVIMLMGCSDGSKKAYNEALIENTENSFTKFITDYPESDWVEPAVKHIHELQKQIAEEKERKRIAEEKERKRIAEEKRRAQPCYGISMTSWRPTGSMYTTASVTIRNDSSKTKYVYLNYKTPKITSWSDWWTDPDRVKVYANDITTVALQATATWQKMTDLKISHCK